MSRANADRPFTVGLTGGIASGKSSVSDRLLALGACVIDTDAIARDLVLPGSPCLEQIRTHFGESVLRDDGTLDRAGMRARISGDALSRKALESILHPAIRTEVLRRVNACAAPDALCVVAIPLLVENRDAYAWLDGVIVVAVSEETQVRRLMLRDQMDDAAARRMLELQARPEQRRAIADWLIDNNGSREELLAQVDALHAQLSAFAQKPRDSIRSQRDRL